jgi:hypothetical protein
MQKYKIFWMCYLDGYDEECANSEVIEAESREEAEEVAFEAGMEHVASWWGLHGFGLTEEEFEEEDPEGDYDEYVFETISATVESWVEKV